MEHHRMQHMKVAKKGKGFSFAIHILLHTKCSIFNSQHDLSPEEEARRHQEGVDAFLSFATGISSMPSPLKRPPSADYVENVPVHNYNNNNNHLFANGNGTYYYNGAASPLSQPFGQQHIYSYMSSSPSPPKKSRTRPIRTKLKKKVWLR